MNYYLRDIEEFTGTGTIDIYDYNLTNKLGLGVYSSETDTAIRDILKDCEHLICKPCRSGSKKNDASTLPGIDKVIFNNPATIVYWKDGTKTVVKCQHGDVFTKDAGLAMCIAKKALGNKGCFNDVLKKWCDN